ncbi:hypothetical protein L209DRAFT_759107 [Thermothelomyces heterothallicus CBS 203.75]
MSTSHLAAAELSFLPSASPAPSPPARGGVATRLKDPRAGGCTRHWPRQLQDGGRGWKHSSGDAYACLKVSPSMSVW